MIRNIVIISLFLSILNATTFNEAVKNLENKNYAKAIEEFTTLALEDNALAQYNLGIINYKGLGIPINHQLAFFWYQQAAKKGNQQAQNNLAHMYFMGEGVNKDLQKSKYWYEQSALQGFALAQLNVAMQYERSPKKENLEKAFYWYEKAAMQGVIIAQNNLASMYYFGKGVKKDLYKAFYWYQKSANANNPVAQLNLGVMYLIGDSAVKKDYEEAIFWLEKSANANNKTALLKLADIYREGNITDVNYKKAFDLYMKASNHNSSKAMYYVGFFYFEGLGVIKNEGRAKVWMKKAEALGHKRARNFLELKGLK